MTAAKASKANPPGSRHGNAYNLSIMVVTVFSLAIMVLRVLPLNEQTSKLLTGYDFLICLIFSADFGWNLATAPVRQDYFIRERGCWTSWAPSQRSAYSSSRAASPGAHQPVHPHFRLSNRKSLLQALLQNRAEYAGLVTLLLAGVVLSTASLIIVGVEANATEGNIESGWDAFWWSFVTMTTVGYGDHFPVTVIGRITATVVMAMGIGIIGALASFLASVLVGGDEKDESAHPDALVAEIEVLRAEVVSLRTALERLTPATLASDSQSPAQSP